jgi:hypothetical protein
MLWTLDLTTQSQTALIDGASITTACTVMDQLSGIGWTREAETHTDATLLWRAFIACATFRSFSQGLKLLPSRAMMVFTGRFHFSQVVMVMSVMVVMGMILSFISLFDILWCESRQGLPVFLVRGALRNVLGLR